MLLRVVETNTSEPGKGPDCTRGLRFAPRMMPRCGSSPSPDSHCHGQPPRPARPVRVEPGFAEQCAAPSVLRGWGSASLQMSRRTRRGLTSSESRGGNRERPFVSVEYDGAAVALAQLAPR